MKLTRKQLKKTYSLADEDYLVAMVEGKIHVVNYMTLKRKELDKEFKNNIMLKINNTLTAYLNFKQRDYFLPEDLKAIMVFKKKFKKMVREYITYSMKVFTTASMELYNYKRMYNLWMLSVAKGVSDFDKPENVGEMAGDKNDKSGIIDPSFNKSTVNKIMSSSPYGSTISERLDNAKQLSDRAIDNSLNSAVSGKGKEFNAFMKKVEKDLTKSLSNKIKNAVEIGLEDVEDYADEDVFTVNPFFDGIKFQRVEVLDKKTCIVCVSLDGQVSDKMLGRIHPHCRGVDVPINTEKKTSETFKSKEERRKSFDNWFNKKSEKEKRQLLGKTKYELYNSGKLNVHDIVKTSRVMGTAEVKRIEKIKAMPAISNDLRTARSVIKQELKKLPNKSIQKLTTQKQINEYAKYIDKKEAIYKAVDSKALKKDGVNRNSLNAEINRERKLLRLKQQEVKLKDALSKKK